MKPAKSRRLNSFQWCTATLEKFHNSSTFGIVPWQSGPKSWIQQEMTGFCRRVGNYLLKGNEARTASDSPGDQVKECLNKQYTPCCSRLPCCFWPPTMLTRSWRWRWDSNVEGKKETAEEEQTSRMECVEMAGRHGFVHITNVPRMQWVCLTWENNCAAFRQTLAGADRYYAVTKGALVLNILTSRLKASGWKLCAYVW